MILFAQIGFRRTLTPAQAKELKFAMPGGIFTAIVGILFLFFIIGLIGYFPDTRVSLYVGIGWIALLLISWTLVKKRIKA
jgi:proline-specific permease ProY